MPENNQILSVEGQLVGMPLAGPESFSQQQLDYLKRALGVDETVLWEGNISSSTTGSQDMAESFMNFERIRVLFTSTVLDSSDVWVDFKPVLRPTYNDGLAQCEVSLRYNNTTYSYLMYVHFTGDNGTKVKLEAGSSFSNGTFTNNVTSLGVALTKVVGIHRIAGGN